MRFGYSVVNHKHLNLRCDCLTTSPFCIIVSKNRDLLTRFSAPLELTRSSEAHQLTFQRSHPFISYIYLIETDRCFTSHAFPCLADVLGRALADVTAEDLREAANLDDVSGFYCKPRVGMSYFTGIRQSIPWMVGCSRIRDLASRELIRRGLS